MQFLCHCEGEARGNLFYLVMTLFFFVHVFFLSFILIFFLFTFSFVAHAPHDKRESEPKAYRSVGLEGGPTRSDRRPVKREEQRPPRSTPATAENHQPYHRKKTRELQDSKSRRKTCQHGCLLRKHRKLLQSHTRVHKTRVQRKGLRTHSRQYHKKRNTLQGENRDTERRSEKPDLISRRL